jgi:arylsulfatase A-like enzyme
MRSLIIAAVVSPVLASATLVEETWNYAAADQAIVPAANRCSGRGVAGNERPNILFIYLDDFGWRDAGFMGSDFYETPNLDALAAGGMVFTHAYSPAPNCAPARASLLSGQYTPRHKVYNVGTAARGDARHRRLLHVPGVDTLDPSLRTWAQSLQSAGYRTAIMGKWHLSEDPLPYGFDVNVAGTHSGSPPQGYYPPHPWVPGLGEYGDDEYLTDTLSERAAQFVREHADEPWMLYLSHFAVHTPLIAKKEFVEKYRNKPPGELHNHVAMATMIQSVDEGVGLIIRALDETGTRERTIILFFSDNGGYGPATDMAPLKGYKGTHYEGGIRVPLFVNWPGIVKPGSMSETPVIGVDLFPTFCEMSGAEIPDHHPLDGISLVPLLKGESSGDPERALFWHFPAYLQSYPMGGHFEQQDPLFRSRPCSVIRKGDWKLLEFFEKGDFELYHLGEDPGETTNRVAEQPEIAAALRAELAAWRERIGADVPTELNPEFDAAAEQQAILRALKH